jgi:hypothetical protein
MIDFMRIYKTFASDRANRGKLLVVAESEGVATVVHQGPANTQTVREAKQLAAESGTPESELAYLHIPHASTFLNER